MGVPAPTISSSNQPTNYSQDNALGWLGLRVGLLECVQILNCTDPLIEQSLDTQHRDSDLVHPP